MTATRAVTALSAAGILAVLVVTLTAAGATSPRRASGPFAWLQPRPAPPSWRLARIPDGAELAYPPGWTAIETDPGTASVALRGDGGEIDGYLNVTPKQGAETLADWSRFRLRKNREEGDRNVRLLAASTDAHLRSAQGSCVIDTYSTSLTTYREIACLLAGPGGSDVVVAAVPARLWHQRSAVLERAVSAFRTSAGG